MGNRINYRMHIVLMLVELQFVRQPSDILLQLMNSNLSFLGTLIGLVPEIHQGFPVMIVKGALPLPLTTLTQESRTLRSQFLILLHKLLQRLCIHTCFSLRGKEKEKSLNEQIKNTHTRPLKSCNVRTLTRSRRFSFSCNLACR
jgi:hypothetical protein